MPQAARVFSLFLASPGDVADESAVIGQLVEEWNQHHGGRLNAFVTVTSWRKNAYAAAGAEPQAIINRQVLDTADIVVANFWTRFGTPTSVAGSGTAEEIERSIAAGKHVMIYYSDRPIPPSKFDAAEYARIDAFRKKHEKHSLQWSYPDLEAFRELFRSQLALLMNDLCATPAASPSPEPAPIDESTDGTISIALPPDYWVIVTAALDHVVQAAKRAADDLRKRGVDPKTLSQEEVTAIIGPLFVRGFVIDVLVKHGVMTKEAGEKHGYATLTRIINELVNVPALSCANEVSVSSSAFGATMVAS
jgi:nucleoside 2-deoxyribosyltransferase